MTITHNKSFLLSYFVFYSGSSKEELHPKLGQNDRLIVDTSSLFAKSHTLHLLGMARFIDLFN